MEKVKLRIRLKIERARLEELLLEVSRLELREVNRDIITAIGYISDAIVQKELSD